MKNKFTFICPHMFSFNYDDDDDEWMNSKRWNFLKKKQTNDRINYSINESFKINWVK